MTGNACTYLDECVFLLICVAGGEVVDGIEIGDLFIFYFLVSLTSR